MESLIMALRHWGMLARAVTGMHQVTVTERERGRGAASLRLAMPNRWGAANYR